jgi:hypothetical protein
MTMIAILNPNKINPPRKGNVVFSTKKRVPSDEGTRLEAIEATLTPGKNELTDEQLELIKAHPDYPQYKQWGAVELVEPTATIEPVTVESLAQYNEDDAIKLIHLSVDLDQLKGWAKVEKRRPVLAALNAHRTKVESGQV